MKKGRKGGRVKVKGKTKLKVNGKGMVKVKWEDHLSNQGWE